MTQYEKEQKLAYIFASQRDFEKEVLMVQNEDERKDIIKLIAHALVYDKLRDNLHFYYVKSREMIDTSLIVNSITYLLIQELLAYVKEELSFTNVESTSLIKEKEILLFVNALSSFYYKRYHEIIFSFSADTLLDKIESQEKPSRFLRECVEGSRDTNSLMLLLTGVKLFYSYDQAYKKIHTVMMMKKSKLKTLQLKLAKIMLDSTAQQSKENSEKYLRIKGEIELVKNQSLDTFDINIKKVKKAISDTMYRL